MLLETSMLPGSMLASCYLVVTSHRRHVPGLLASTFRRFQQLSDSWIPCVAAIESDSCYSTHGASTKMDDLDFLIHLVTSDNQKHVVAV